MRKFFFFSDYTIVLTKKEKIMHINSNSSLYSTSKISKSVKAPVFGTKYPFEDVMAIMSGSFAHNIDSTSRTAVSILKCNAGNSLRLAEYYLKARTVLQKKYLELIPVAENFRKALDEINYNHFAISKEQASKIIDNESKKYGSRFIDIEI